MSDPMLRRWANVGLAALVVIVVTIPLSLLRRGTVGVGAGALDEQPTFAGTDACRDCHQLAYERWLGSDHDLAMAEATEETVLGDFDDAAATLNGVPSRFHRRDGGFFVSTQGPDGTPTEFQVTHTFGFEPLQQYLTPFPGGRLQALSLAWDTERRRWFYLYPGQAIPPDDWLHWTRGGQNWNGMCAECHSTNLQKGYDPATRSYDTTWSDIDVGCEACHGPGSLHVAWAEVPDMARPELANQGLVQRTSGIDGPQLVELCAPCHSRRAELSDYDHTGSQLLDHMLPSLLAEGLYHPDGQILDEVYVYGSFLQSKMYNRDVRCADCHDSHSLKLHLEGNELCLQCHQRETYDSYEHHFHQKVYEGEPSDGALCVKCHMVEQPFMVVDWRADHSFRLPRPDLSRDLGTPNACTQGGCHDNRPLSWSLDAHRRWYGLARRPHYGTTFAAAREQNPEARDELIRLARNTLQPALVRATALSLLERYPGEASTETLRAAVLEEEPLLRRTAAASVVIGDPAERVALLAPLLADPIRAVRLAAVSQLAGVPDDLLKPYQREALERGVREYRESMAYSLDFASSGMNLGNLEVSLGNPSDAERYYRLALAIDDLFYPAKMNLAVLASQQGRNTEAARLLGEVLQAYPDNADAAYSLGLLQVELGEMEQAVELLRRAAGARPRFARGRYNLGLLEQQLGNAEAAERALASAMELEPGNPEYVYALAHHHMGRGLPARALPLARRLVEMRPDDANARQFLAAVQQALEDSSSR